MPVVLYGRSTVVPHTEGKIETTVILKHALLSMISSTNHVTSNDRMATNAE